MRHLVLASLLLGILGCGQSEPTLAGGKPVSYWSDSMHSPDAALRKKAVMKLGNVGPSDPAVKPVLLEALKDTDAGVRKEAIAALMKYGADAKEALPTLIEMATKDASNEVRASADKAAQRLRDP
jgi:HEAT repeat protein